MSPADIPYHAGTPQPTVILHHGYPQSATASRTHTAADGPTSTTPAPLSVPHPRPLSGTRGDKLSATPRHPHCHPLLPGGHTSDARPCPGDKLGTTPCRHLLPSGGHASDTLSPGDELGATLYRPPHHHLLPSGGHANEVSCPCPGDELSATSRRPPYHHLLPSRGHARDVALRHPAPSPAHPARILLTVTTGTVVATDTNVITTAPPVTVTTGPLPPPSAAPNHPPTAWPAASNGVSTLILTPYSSHLSQWGQYPAKHRPTGFGTSGQLPILPPGWRRGTARYLCVRLYAQPSLALELSTYQTTLAMLFSHYPATACIRYDQLFWQATGRDPSLRWDVVREDLHVWCFTRRPISPPPLPERPLPERRPQQSFHDRPPITSRLGPPPSTPRVFFALPQGTKSAGTTTEATAPEERSAPMPTCWSPGCHGPHPGKDCPKRSTRAPRSPNPPTTLSI